MKYADPTLRDQLAAAYALGTLRGRARHRFERLMAADPALDRLAREWELRLNVLAEGAPAVEPPAHLWRRIEERLAAPVPASAGMRRRSALAALFGRPRVRLPGFRDAGFWNFVGFWRPAGLAAAAIAAVLVAWIALTPAPVRPSHTAVLSEPSIPLVLVADLALDDRRLSFRAMTLPEARPDQSLELWVVPEEGAPRSLGLLLPDPKAIELSAENAAALAGGTLAVSREPAGGSPTGAPTEVLTGGRMLPAI
jgi:anti-sigma-K factor RskA